MKTIVVAALGCYFMLTTVFAAEPTVTDVTAKQRYPWNGLVDITCKVQGINGTTNGLKFAVVAVMPDSGDVRKASQFWLVQGGINSTDRKVHTNGNYRLLWDARADLNQVVYSNVVVRVNLDDLHDKVQLWEGGPYWATTNIGAEEPWEYGYYFWWGDTVGYKRQGDAWVASDGSSSNFSFDSSSTPTYGKTLATLQSEGWVVLQDGTYVLAPEHDAAQVQWGGGWRMPTFDELEYLFVKCNWTRTTKNGVNGYVVSGNGDYASSSIFLPFAGEGVGTSLYDSGSYGCYWSSVPNWVDSTCGSGFVGCGKGSRVLFTSYRHNGDNDRNFGQSIRPVQGFTK